VDVVPFKVCTLDCTYCQLGHTTRHATARQMFVPVAKVVEQVGEAIARGPRPDIITFAGSGEPTLYSGLGELAKQLRIAYSVPLLLITNGTLLWQAEVATEAASFDLVAPSLDAGNETTFNLLNRPAPGITYDLLLDGLSRFATTHPEKMRLEIFFVAGINDSAEEVESLVEAVTAIGPPTVELNTAVRPTADGTVRGVSAEFLAAVAGRFPCPATPIAAPAAAVHRESRPGAEELRLEILATLARRPCTAADLCASLGVDQACIEEALAALQAGQKVASQVRSNARYYVLRS